MSTPIDAVPMTAQTKMGALWLQNPGMGTHGHNMGIPKSGHTNGSGRLVTPYIRVTNRPYGQHRITEQKPTKLQPITPGILGGLQAAEGNTGYEDMA